MNISSFADFGLADPIKLALNVAKLVTPTPIQARAIPELMAGRDVLGVAQTGTGKTAAFALPLLHRLSKNIEPAARHRPRALILAPTRELAAQIGASLSTFAAGTGVRSTVVFGGVPIRRQIQILSRGVHVLVATPGRLLDLMNQREVRLDAVEFFVLDEADRMLDMGFVRDVKKITAALSVRRQTALFSATMPQTVQGLVDSLLRDPVRIDVAPPATTADHIEQHVLFVPKEKKSALLGELLRDTDLKRVLIFTRTKRGADRVAKHLVQSGIRSGAIHGNKAQNAREKALEGFRTGDLRALVATDIAARGIDVAGVTHVINFELPDDPENYVHRIGRTARAGASGIALSLCGPDERSTLRDIEKIIRIRVPVMADHPFHSAEPANDVVRAAPAAPASKRPQRRRGGPRQRASIAA